MTAAFDAYNRLTNHHDTPNGWANNLTDLWHHLNRVNAGTDPTARHQAITLIHTMRAALNAIEAALSVGEEAA